MMLKWAVFGSTGLLGFSLCKELVKKNQKVFGVCSKKTDGFNTCENHVFDAVNFESVRDFFKKIKPDVVVNCIALTDLNLAEDDKDLAYDLNVIVAKNLAKACLEHGSKLVHISTDSVFDGEKGNYVEEDITNPLNNYASTKLEAEKEVKKIFPKSLILRTNMYGTNYKNKTSLAEWFIKNLEKNQKVIGFDDVFFNPLLTNNISQCIIELVQKNVIGLFHLGSGNSLSKYDFGLKVAEIFGLDKELIKKGKIDDLNLVPERPKNTTLNIDKVSKIIESQLLDAKLGLKRMKELKKGDL